MKRPVYEADHSIPSSAKFKNEGIYTFLPAYTFMACKGRISRRYFESWEYAVAQLVEALRYKPEGRGFDFRWSHWNFSVT